MQFQVHWKTHILWLLIVIAAVGSVRSADEQKEPAPPKSEADEYYELMQVFVDTFEQVERNYVKPVDRRKLLEAAVRGMLEELDPYSNYIPPEELARFNQNVKQEFGGIGIQVQPHAQSNRILVISPLPDTPAWRSGIRAGDLILEVQGEDTENMSLTRAVELMKGPAGEPVKLKIRHMGETADQEVTVERAIIQVKSVLGDHYRKDGSWEHFIDRDKGIAYIRLTQFGEQSADELAKALHGLTEDGLKGLILDLRMNPGGLLSQAVQVSDLFVESGTIVSVEGKNTEKKVFSATKPGTYGNFPMVVLINRFSASASEIVSACLQDHNRATVIGERSWGKASVQNIIELESGKSALKLTTAGYKRPSGKNIHREVNDKPTDEWGVKPNEGFDVRFSTDELQAWDTYRRARDILSENGPPASDFKDKQVERALEHLRAVLNGEKPANSAEARPMEKQAA